MREDACPFNTDTPENLHRFWLEIIATQPDHEPDKESVVVVMMNARLRPYAWHRVSLGSVNECSAQPREILRPVIVSGAFGFALMHNHPSGDPGPSRADDIVILALLGFCGGNRMIPEGGCLNSNHITLELGHVGRCGHCLAENLIITLTADSQHADHEWHLRG